MMIGIAGSLDEALHRATTGMAHYLDGEYGLNSTEAVLVLGLAVKCRNKLRQPAGCGYNQTELYERFL